MKDQNVQFFGILNITPDSFSDGGQYFSTQAALEQAQKLFSDGADYVDVGGQSTAPNAEEITPQEEWGRVEIVLRALLASYPGKVSLDTKHPETAESFLKLGGRVLNDVSGFQRREMCLLAAEYQPLCVVNHFPGSMIAEVHEQKISSIEKVRDDLLERKQMLIEAGVCPENIILDPGIGFGKTMDLNWELLKFAQHVPGEKVLIGHSKKRFLGEKRFETEPNLEAAKTAIEAGTAYLRVHEVGLYQETERCSRSSLL